MDGREAAGLAHTEQPAKRPVSLALFDFDGTLIAGDSIGAYTLFAWKRGAMTGRELLRAMGGALLYGLKKLGPAESKNRALAFRSRLTPPQREALDRAFAEEALLPRVYPAGRECLQAHRQAGRMLLLVTASTENYMRFVADGLGFDGLLATGLDENSRVTVNCKGEEKARRVREWLKERGLEADFAASFAYGDSKSDLPLLRLCGHPVLVNPKRALGRKAPDMQRVKWK